MICLLHSWKMFINDISITLHCWKIPAFYKSVKNMRAEIEKCTVWNLTLEAHSNINKPEMGLPCRMTPHKKQNSFERRWNTRSFKVTWHVIYTILSLFSLHVEPAPHLLSPTARPSVSSSLQITNLSFRYALPYLWNQLPSSFC